MFALLTFTFFICAARGDSLTAKGDGEEKGGIISLIEDKIEIKVGEYVKDFTKMLADFNDRHLGASVIGRMIHYDEIKPSLDAEAGRSKSSPKSMKKMSMAMMPLVFHVGATSTWMLITSIMAAKSVAIGLALLVFKIAVSSAKLGSFFTLLKGKHHEEHHGWSYSPPHHYEHHGHERSFSELEHHSDHSGSSHQTAWNSYSPEWTPDAPDYNTIPISYHHGELDAPYPHAEDRKKAEKKKFA